MDTKERYWDCWQSKEVVDEIIPFLGSPDNAFGGKLPEWFPEFKSVLDIGCGCGIYYKVLTSNGAEYVGLDSSPHMIEEAKKCNPTGVFAVGDIFNIGFDTDTFDLVFCNAVLIHLPVLCEVVNEMLRVSTRYVIFNLYAHEETIEIRGPSGEILKAWAYEYLDSFLADKRITHKETFTCEKLKLNGIQVDEVRFLIEKPQA